MDELAKAFEDLRTAIADAKYDLNKKITNATRWSLVFCIGSTAITIGVMWLMLKK